MVPPTAHKDPPRLPSTNNKKRKSDYNIQEQSQETTRNPTGSPTSHPTVKPAVAALNNPNTVVPTESIQQSTVIPTQSNQPPSSNKSNKRKSTTNVTSNPTAHPTTDTTSKKQKKDEKALSQKEKQKLDIANKLYNVEVDSEDSDDVDIPGDQKKKFESIAELEEFADESYLNNISTIK
jgi:hypothetical protein